MSVLKVRSLKPGRPSAAHMALNLSILAYSPETKITGKRNTVAHSVVIAYTLAALPMASLSTGSASTRLFSCPRKAEATLAVQPARSAATVKSSSCADAIMMPPMMGMSIATFALDSTLLYTK